ncbi:metal-sulfur cluster assembly factor [Candidatus Falkowbacteria bacterium]|nr:metal-sulfur cluster assembly factor [Candidatus Falkowbacteria bacterium]
MENTKREKIIEELKKVVDPELGIDVWTLGLIYEITIVSDAKAHILMTFTSPLCPVGGLIIAKVTEAVKDAGFEDVDIEITFEPAWKPTKELRAMYGI